MGMRGQPDGSDVAAVEPRPVSSRTLLSAVWTLHIDPILSIILGAVPSYFFGVWFTENIFAQKPLVTTSACPNCGTLNTVFFGDLFSVRADGLAGPKTPVSDTVRPPAAAAAGPTAPPRVRVPRRADQANAATRAVPRSRAGLGAEAHPTSPMRPALAKTGSETNFRVPLALRAGAP